MSKLDMIIDELSQSFNDLIEALEEIVRQPNSPSARIMLFACYKDLLHFFELESELTNNEVAQECLQVIIKTVLQARDDIISYSGYHQYNSVLSFLTKMEDQLKAFTKPVKETYKYEYEQSLENDRNRDDHWITDKLSKIPHLRAGTIQRIQTEIFDNYVHARDLQHEENSTIIREDSFSKLGMEAVDELRKREIAYAKRFPKTRKE